MAAKANVPAMSARNETIKRLIEAHRDEYDQILAEERTSRGLPANPAQAEREKRIARLLSQLKELGVEVQGTNSNH